MKNKKIKKYAYGGITIDTPTPEEINFNAKRMVQESAIEAANDPTVMLMNSLGSLATNAGLNLLTAGLGSADFKPTSGFGKFLKNNPNILKQTFNGLQPLSMFAFGGTTPNMIANVEGDEVAENPLGQVVQFKGPKHEQGGINVDLPQGVDIYSDRIKVDGKSLAERKKEREIELKKLRKKKDKNNYNTLLDNTWKRTNEVNDIQDEMEKALQEEIKNQLSDTDINEQDITPQFKFGRDGDNDFIKLLGGFKTDPSFVPSENKLSLFNIFKPESDGSSLYNDIIEKDEQNYYQNSVNPTASIVNEQLRNNQHKEALDRLNNFMSTNPENIKPSTDTNGNNILSKILDGTGLDEATFGDLLGMAGNIYQGIAPIRNTISQREGDTPNINPYKDYGKDSLNQLRQNLPLYDYLYDKAGQELEASKRAAMDRNHNTARGISTLRALDLATQFGTDKALNDLYDKKVQSIAGYNKEMADLQKEIDKMVMYGESQKDMNDRRDRDNFFSQLGEDKLSLGQALAHIGKSVNTLKSRKVTNKLINQLSDFVNANVYNGDISQKKNVEAVVKDYLLRLQQQRDANAATSKEKNKSKSK